MPLIHATLVVVLFEIEHTHRNESVVSMLEQNFALGIRGEPQRLSNSQVATASNRHKPIAHRPTLERHHRVVPRLRGSNREGSLASERLKPTSRTWCVRIRGRSQHHAHLRGRTCHQAEQQSESHGNHTRETSRRIPVTCAHDACSRSWCSRRD